MYTNPVPPLATFKAQRATVAKDEEQAGKVVGGAATRNASRAVLVSMIETQRAVVQALADAATPEQAIIIIEKAGMFVALVAVRNKPLLRATGGTQPGVVGLEANASTLLGKKRWAAKFFAWQSTHDGGKTWSDLPSTPHAKTTVTNLPPLTECGFRVAVNTGGGLGPWSQMVTVFVH